MKRASFISVAAVVLSLVCVNAARAGRIPVSGEIVGVEVIDFGDLTITPSGIVILEGLVTDETLTGDLAGTIRVTSTLIVDPTTGEGFLFGTIDWKDPNSIGGLRGYFFGDVSGAFAPGLGEFDGQWLLAGYGSHRGKTAHIDNFGPFSLPQIYEGVILAPSKR